MILVTGGTGFIGRHLVKALAETGHQVRILLRPSNESPRIPRGIPVEVAVSSLSDFRGLRAAMKDVDIIYHFAGAERNGTQANLNLVDIEGSKNVAQAASEAGIKRFITMSHLGADRSSAYPVLKAKAIAEKFIIDSGVPYTIFRTDAIYGPGDQFTEPILKELRRSPGFFILPGYGDSILQPLSIKDLTLLLLLSLENPQTIRQIYSIGGAELLTYQEIVKTIADRANLHRLLIPASLKSVRRMMLWLDQLDRQFPISIFWLDTLAENRTCTIDLLPREFGIMPGRFHRQLDYLSHR